jgi:hypothetical protein
MSASGKWDYSQCGHTASYGDDTTYRMGADFLRGLSVEDWGCGLGWYKQFHEGPYVGIDGSKSIATDIVGDLMGRTHVQTKPEAIFMRHVLEHNRTWRVILRNAVLAFQKRMVVVVFTPFEDVERELTPQWSPIPDIALPRRDFAHIIWDVDETYRIAPRRVESKSRYGFETIFCIEK